MTDSQKRVFLPGQKKFLEDPSDEVLYSGAFGSGKTRALCEKALLLSMLYPGNRGLICRKQLMGTRSTTMVTLMEGDGTMPAVIPPSYVGSYHRNDRRVILKNGSEILFGGLGISDDINWIKSLNLGWFGVDQAEEISYADWMLLLGRLRLNLPDIRQGLAVCNPAHPSHWLYQRFFVEKPDGTSVIEANTLENKYLPIDYKRRLMNFKGVHRLRYVLGKWVQFEGMVWPHFNPSTHVIPPFEIPPGWVRFRSIDFGYVSPLVCQWWAVAPKDYMGYPEGSMFLYREWYMSRWTIPRHAEMILDLSADESISYTVCDHDAENRADLEAAGILTIPAEKGIKRGIQEVDTRLGNYYLDRTTGEVIESQNDGIYIAPTLYIFKNALVQIDETLRYDSDGQPTGTPYCTADEIPNYLWERTRAGVVKELPRGKNDHGCDTMRYACMSQRYGGYHGLFI